MKKKSLVLSVCMAFATPAISHADILPVKLLGLSLGEIATSSHLNQPFEGEIPILFTTLEQSKLLKIRLAPASIFQQIGTEKLTILDQLVFRISEKNGKPFISIRSQVPIQVPFLNFVLEIDGPEGRAYQDYTVLLDPDNYQSIASYNINLQNPASQSSQSDIGIEFDSSSDLQLPVVDETESIEKTLLKVQNELMLAVSSSPRLLKGKPTQYRVKTGDSVSKIAQIVNTGEITLQRMVQGLFLGNPHAFLNQNINQLKKGVVLNIPTLSQISQLEQAQNISTQKIATHKADNPVQSNVNEHAVIHTSPDKNIIQKKEANNSRYEGGTYTIKKGDTLYAIVKKQVDGTSSISRTMKAIHQANPQAFSNNNINYLKIGSVLQLPAQDVKQVDIPRQEDPQITQDLAKTIPIQDTARVPSNTSTNEYLLNGYTVKKGDTLADITKEIGYKNVSRTKMMKAIYSANPDAFLESNITILKPGSVIRLPTLGETNGIARNLASEEVASSKPEKSAAKQLFDSTTINKKSGNITPETSATIYNAYVIPEQETVTEQNIAKTNNGNQNTTINKLEKRLRELRNDLTQAKNNLESLEFALREKDQKLNAQNSILENIKNRTSELESENLELTEKLVDAGISFEEELTKSLEIPAEIDLGSQNDTNPKDTQQNTVQNEWQKSERIGYIPDRAESKLKEAISTMMGSVSNKNMFYTAMALFLGFLLIRYRRELYEYTAISYNYPKYYPAEKKKKNYLSAKESEALKKDIINFQQTLVHSENPEDMKIGDEFLHECEDLLDDLETSNGDANTERGAKFDKICNDYIDNFKDDINLDTLTPTPSSFSNELDQTEEKAEELTLDLFKPIDMVEINTDDTQKASTEESIDDELLNLAFANSESLDLATEAASFSDQPETDSDDAFDLEQEQIKPFDLDWKDYLGEESPEAEDNEVQKEQDKLSPEQNSNLVNSKTNENGKLQITRNETHKSRRYLLNESIMDEVELENFEDLETIEDVTVDEDVEVDMEDSHSQDATRENPVSELLDAIISASKNTLPLPQADDDIAYYEEYCQMTNNIEELTNNESLSPTI